jgi:soluble lytic murein transglycosylase-like protein
MRKSWAVLPLAGLVAAGAGVLVWYGDQPPTVPAEYRSVLVSAASRCPGLDPRLLAAQLEQESGWDAQASSRVGAQGLAQFMPAVWQAYAVDGDGDGVKDVWNPKDAIASAAHFDCVLMKDVAAVPGDQVRNMLAAYNAGPDQVRRYRGVPPFRETRAYVQRIVERAKVLTVGPQA